MISQLLLTAAFALLAVVRSQSSTASYVEPGVPTGVPVAGNYTGALRPQIHYSPPKGFMASGFHSFMRSHRFLPFDLFEA